MRTTSASRARTLALVLLLTLAGCVTTTGGNATKSALCDQFRPIRWADADTDETISQAKAHNAVGKRLCGWKAG